MLEKLIKLYTTSMITGVTSPMPHVVGPPGCGKSTVFRQLAELMGVNLHVVNVSRISPLGLEGLEMPDAQQIKLQLLHSEMWTKLKDGDIMLFDEFLRGFPEVYNGLLDIFTSREVAGLKLPRVFIAGASNSTIAYDGALEDRLLHIPVDDPRKSRAARNRLVQLLIDGIGLNPEVVTAYEMTALIDTEVLPMFDVLDSFKSGLRTNVSVGTGTSLRKLIGQALLREVTSQKLRELISVNNSISMPHKPQYVILLDGKHTPSGYESAASALRGHDRLTDLQRQNLEINLQLIAMEKVKSERNEATDDSFDPDQ